MCDGCWERRFEHANRGTPSKELDIVRGLPSISCHDPVFDNFDQQSLRLVFQLVRNMCQYFRDHDLRISICSNHTDKL